MILTHSPLRTTSLRKASSRSCASILPQVSVNLCIVGNVTKADIERLKKRLTYLQRDLRRKRKKAASNNEHSLAHQANVKPLGSEGAFVRLGI